MPKDYSKIFLLVLCLLSFVAKIGVHGQESQKECDTLVLTNDRVLVVNLVNISEQTIYYYICQDSNRIIRKMPHTYIKQIIGQVDTTHSLPLSDLLNRNFSTAKEKGYEIPYWKFENKQSGKIREIEKHQEIKLNIKYSNGKSRNIKGNWIELSDTTLTIIDKANKVVEFPKENVATIKTEKENSSINKISGYILLLAGLILLGFGVSASSKSIGQSTSEAINEGCANILMPFGISSSSSTPQRSKKSYGCIKSLLGIALVVCGIILLNKAAPDSIANPFDGSWIITHIMVP